MKTRRSAIFPIINPILYDLGSNSNRHDGKY
jgi:hypothetical protein